MNNDVALLVFVSTIFNEGAYLSFKASIWPLNMVLFLFGLYTLDFTLHTYTPSGCMQAMYWRISVDTCTTRFVHSLVTYILESTFF